MIGSNVFNLAALLGLGAVVAGEIKLHPRVILLEGTVAIAIATICLGVVLGGPGPGIGLLAAVAVLVPYLIVSGVSPRRLAGLGLPRSWAAWLSGVVAEEEQELEPAIHPPPADARDVLLALLATAVVVGASVAMELTASTLGARHHVAEIVIGGLVLAGVTSLPNAVSALYLAVRGRGAATLSIALNSNALNVTVGLLLPGLLVGLGAPSGQGTLVAAWYLGLTAVTLACAYTGRGLRRTHGALIISGYLGSSPRSSSPADSAGRVTIPLAASYATPAARRRLSGPERRRETRATAGLADAQRHRGRAPSCRKRTAQQMFNPRGRSRHPFALSSQTVAELAGASQLPIFERVLGACDCRSSDPYPVVTDLRAHTGVWSVQIARPDR